MENSMDRTMNAETGNKLKRIKNTCNQRNPNRKKLSISNANWSICSSFSSLRWPSERQNLLGDIHLVGNLRYLIYMILLNYINYEFCIIICYLSRFRINLLLISKNISVNHLKAYTQDTISMRCYFFYMQLFSLYAGHMQKACGWKRQNTKKKEIS